MSDDRRFMEEAIGMGRRHLGQTGANPSVGCVVVRDGAVVGRAVTALGGRPHAEPQALAQAGTLAEGATAYVTLEPCSHYGKTPPCAEALIAARVKRVVVALRDPDPRVSGRGLAMLEAAGIEVEAGVMEAEAREGLKAYLTRQTLGRPLVTLKLAVSADGMIGRRGEGQIAITGPLARAEVQRMRGESDAILVGIGTALADDPLLTVRTAGEEWRSPQRFVLDPQLSLPLSSKLVQTAATVKLVVVAAAPLPEEEAAFEERRQTLEAAGAEVLQCDPARLDLLLPALASRGISSLFVEGGAQTAQRFLDADLVDRIFLFTGSTIIGEGGLESPLDAADMPQGFIRRSETVFGPDRLALYERED